MATGLCVEDDGSSPAVDTAVPFLEIVGDPASSETDGVPASKCPDPLDRVAQVFLLVDESVVLEFCKAPEEMVVQKVLSVVREAIACVAHAIQCPKLTLNMTIGPYSEVAQRRAPRT